MPDDLKTINHSAFLDAPLEEVKLPKNMTYISMVFFRNCKSLQTVILPPKLKKIDAYAFHNCNSLKNIKSQNINIIVGEETFKNTPIFKSTSIVEHIKEHKNQGIKQR